MTPKTPKVRAKASTTAVKKGKHLDELLGKDTRETMDAEAWTKLMREGQCPFTAGRCTKTRKSDETAVIGTCTLRYNSTPTIICPNRLLGKDTATGKIRLFQDAATLVGISVDDVRYVSEVKIPGGNVDFVLYGGANGTPENFVGIEIQTLDTTGSAWPTRELFLTSIGVTDEKLLSPRATGKQKSKQYGMNWKMTAKTIMVQMLHKVETFEHLKGKLVLAIQQPLWETFLGSFNFDHIATKKHDQSDVVHFFVYSMVDQGTSYTLSEPTKYSATVQEINDALKLKQDQKIDLAVLQQRIKGRPQHQLTEVPEPLNAEGNAGSAEAAHDQAIEGGSEEE